MKLKSFKFQVSRFKFFMLNSLLIGSPFVRGDVEDRGVKKLIVTRCGLRVQSSKFKVFYTENCDCFLFFKCPLWGRAKRRGVFLRLKLKTSSIIVFHRNFRTIRFILQFCCLRNNTFFTAIFYEIQARSYFWFHCSFGKSTHLHVFNSVGII